MEDQTHERLITGVDNVGQRLETAQEANESVNYSYFDAKVMEEEKLRQKLAFYFMNPIEKWYYKHRFPCKLVIQIIKIIAVTLQACLFAHHRSFQVDFVLTSDVVFRHLFLLGWDSSLEITTFPPPLPSLTIYRTSEFFSTIDYAAVGYANLDKAIGIYGYTEENNNIQPLRFCFNYYKECNVFGFNESYIIDTEILRSCVEISLDKENVGNFSSEQFFKENNVSLKFSSLVDARLSFGIKTINMKLAGPKVPPDCYRFNVTIAFKNEARNGQMKISLDSESYKLHCGGEIDYKNDTHLEAILHLTLNSIVIFVCIISALLCSRAVYRAQKLKRRTVNFFKKYYNKEISLKARLEFVNFWYLTMIISDGIVIIGTSIKEHIEENEFSGDDWNMCSVFLGTGTFLIWFCILRYLGFFKAYNVVILTLKVAIPMILRFLVCTMFIFAGFVFCGWLILGPYHMKFRTISVTSECLFALINGDDIFATFGTLQPTKSTLIWWFLRIYLYLFISLFIYVILSLFVSVILDAYETIKRYYEEGFPKSEITEFLEGGNGVNFYSDASSSVDGDLPFDFPNSFNLKNIFRRVCCCRPTDDRKDSESIN